MNKGLRRREREAGMGSNPTPASFPHLHCPQVQVCAAAELQRGRRLAFSSTLSETGLTQVGNE
ncbi:MAG: hypothetical protein KAS81_03940, partial [Anaerolineales bacterium]|nr:hypothetical protein [Anaerolineales bacterium]